MHLYKKQARVAERKRKLINRAKRIKLEKVAPDLLAACKIHQDCMELDSLALTEDFESIHKILNKHKVISSIELETLRDSKIIGAIFKVEGEQYE